MRDDDDGLNQSRCLYGVIIYRHTLTALETELNCQIAAIAVMTPSIVLDIVM